MRGSSTGRVRDDRRARGGAAAAAGREQPGDRLADLRLRRRAAAASRRRRCSPPFRRVWMFRARQLLEFPPAIAYGRLYFANNSGVIFAVNAKTGKRAWSSRRAAAWPRRPPSPATPSSQAFLNRPPCNSEARRAARGRGGRLRGGLREDPLADAHRPDRVLAARRERASSTSATGAAASTRSTSGRAACAGRSRRAAGSRARSRCRGGRLYVGTYDGHVYALDATHGQADLARVGRRTGFGGRGQFYSTPAAAYGRIYIGSTDGKVYSFGATSGKLRWSQGTGGYVYSSPAVWRQTVYAGSYSGRFYALRRGHRRRRLALQGERPDLGLADGHERRRLLRHARGAHVRARRAQRQLLWTFAGRQVHAASSPTASGSTSSATPASTGWLSGEQVRRHGRGRVHRLAPRRGAAGAAATRSSASTAFTDYYDPALKEQNARGARRARRLDLAEDELDFAGFDGVFHLAAQPGVRSFGDVLPALRAPQRARDAARPRGRRARPASRVVFASSSSVYGEAERYPTPEETPPRPLSPYGITKLACEHLAAAYGRSFGLDAVVLRYFNAYGPRQRPDMAFTAHRRPRSPPAPPFDALRRRRADAAASRTSATWSRRRIARHGRRRGRALYNVGGGQEATMNETIALLERISGRRARRPPRAAGARRPAAHESRHDADPAPTWAGSRARRSRTACARNGQWAASLESPRDERALRRSPSSTPSRRSTSARRGQRSSRAGGCRSRGSSSARSSASRSRSAAARSTRPRRCSTSASRSRRRAAADPEPRDEPAHRQRDHPLRGGAEGGGAGGGHARRPAARQRARRRSRPSASRGS